MSQLDVLPFRCKFNLDKFDELRLLSFVQNQEYVFYFMIETTFKLFES